MRAASTLLWEQWRQTAWPAFAAIAGLLTTSLILGHWFEFVRNLDELTAAVFANLPWFFLGVVVLLAFVHEDTKGLRLDFPRHLLTSPVSTFLLVSVQFFYRLALTTAAALAAAQLTRNMGTDIVFPTVIGVAVLQALSCTATAFGVAAAVRALIIMVALAILLSLSGLLRPGTVFMLWLSNNASTQMSALALAVLATWAYSLFAITVARGHTWAPALPEVPERVQVRSLTTQHYAQLWFDWQYVIRWMVLAAFVALAGAVPLDVSGSLNDSAFVLLLFLIGWAGGFQLLRLRGASETMAARLPWNTAHLAQAKMLSAAATVACLLPVILLWAALSAESISRHHTSTDTWLQAQWEIMGMPIVSVEVVSALGVLLALLFATILAGRMLLIVYTCGLLAGNLILLPLYEAPPETQAIYVPVALGALCGAVAWALLSLCAPLTTGQRLLQTAVVTLCAWGFFIFTGAYSEVTACLMVLGLSVLYALGRAALAQRLMTHRGFRVVFIGACFACAIPMASEYFASGSFSKDGPYVLACVIPLAVIPFFWTPLLLHLQRHR